jgi:integrase
MLDINNEIKQTPTEIKSESQKNNWIEWEQVKEIYNNLKEKALELPKKIKTENQYNILLQYLILSLYVLIPPRRNSDYQKMKILKGLYENDKDTNYYDGSDFIFNSYKTSKTHGAQILEIPEELNQVIKLYIKHHPLAIGRKYSIPFLVHFNGSSFDKINDITYILNKIFNRKIGSSMLRHIYISYKFGDINKDMENTAEMMGHNTQTQKDYIKS